MAAKVLDLDIAALPPEIDGLTGYDQAYVVFRLHGRPVARVWLPVENGRLARAECQAAIAQAGDWPLWQVWLDHYLTEETGLIEPPPSPHKATIAICTRDHPDDLRRCLDAFQQLPDDGQEVLVVDNCPATEDTFRLVAGYPRVRYVREPRPGLNVARNRALREASHDIIAFNDDDAVPEPGWLRALLANFSDERVLAVTGLTLPLELETAAQVWFERYSSFQRGFQRQSFDMFHWPPLSAARVGAGANMALRRRVLDAVGPFDEALDAGTPTYSGGDTEMFSRILVNGYQIVYEPTAVNHHRHRRTKDELRQVLYGYGVGTYAIWTRQLLFEHEWTVPVLAARWFWQDQLPDLIRSLLKRPDSIPADLLLAQLKGCFVGPWAYLLARRQRRGQPVIQEASYA